MHHTIRWHVSPPHLNARTAAPARYQLRRTAHGMVAQQAGPPRSQIHQLVGGRRSRPVSRVALRPRGLLGRISIWRICLQFWAAPDDSDGD